MISHIENGMGKSTKDNKPQREIILDNKKSINTKTLTKFLCFLGTVFSALPE